METLLIIVHVLVCLFLVGIVLLQHGKGADIGASFGGSSQSLFGSEGPVPLLNKVTTAVAIIFMVTSVSLAYISANKSHQSVMKEVSVQQAAPLEKDSEPFSVEVNSDTEKEAGEKQAQEQEAAQ